MTPDWVAMLAGPAVNLVLLFVGFGMLKSEVKRNTVDQAETTKQILKLREHTINLRLELHDRFVTYENFREFRREVIQTQTQTNAKIDKLLEMVGKLHGSPQ